MTSFQQVPLDHAINRLEKSHHVCEDVRRTFAAYTELHDRMANNIHKIGRPNIFENEIFHSSSERALGFMKNYFLYSAREAAEFTKSMSDSVCKSMDSFMAQQTSQHVEHKLRVQQASKEVSSLVDKLSKAKKVRAKAQREITGLEDRILALGENEASRSEIERLNLKLRRLHDELPGQEQDITLLKADLHMHIQQRDDAVTAALTAFQQSEQNRLEFTKNLFVEFTECESRYMEARQKLMATFQQAVTAMEPQRDLELFIERNKNPDMTHSFSSALTLLDWDSQRRRRATAPSQDFGDISPAAESACQQTIRAALSVVFSHEQAETKEEEYDWPTLLSSEIGRQQVVRLLNQNRTKSCVKPFQFDFMCKVLSKMLDVCLVEKDVKRAMQVANMGNTFFQVVTVDGEEHKEYLNSQLSQHEIWQARQFWEDALMQGVAEQFDMVPQVQWDELGPDALREAVLRVHNTVYGQLGSISLNMKGAGMEKPEVVSFVTGICRRSQLTEEQESELLRHVDAIFAEPESSSQSTSNPPSPTNGDQSPIVENGGQEQSASSDDFDLL